MFEIFNVGDPAIFEIVLLQIATGPNNKQREPTIIFAHNFFCPTFECLTPPSSALPPPPLLSPRNDPAGSPPLPPAS
jgi:hypothetical protein